jgi:TolB-like protein/cytochrome c-type biogenesis protein CcmH/NrfG
MPAVFLSYASQDAAAAKKICDSLRAAGLEVWFDQNELVGGDAWDQKIRGQIKACALFVPLISAETQARREGYFRLEWKLAAQRTHTIADGTPFLLPVVIDATRDAEALVPEEFRAVQWTRLPAGETTAAFVARVKNLLTDSTADVGRGLPTPPPSHATGNPAGSGDPALQPKRSAFPWVIAALAVVVLGLVAFIALRPAAKETPAALLPAKSVVETKPAPSPSVVPQVDAKSIAVLPFVNRSAEKADEFFTDGIHEDILTNLAHIRDLHVVSRTSVMDYRGTAKKIPQIARELNVAFILEGSVQRAGNKVRVTGQLIRAATDEHVWAENFDRDVSDIFAIQSELAQKIATALQTTLSPAEQKLITNRPTQNTEAYDSYLKGRAVVGGRIQGPDLQDQQLAFERAVQLDPNFAEAWGELAVVHGRFAVALERTPERVAKADEAMAKALALQRDSPEILRLLARFSASAHLDFSRAVAALNQVLKVQPNDPLIWAELAGIEIDRIEIANALKAASKSVALDPANTGYRSQLVTVYSLARRWDEAIAEQRRLVGLRPGNLEYARRLAMLSFQSTGDSKPMEGFFAALTPRQANSPDLLLARKEWYFLRGDISAYLKLDRIFPYHPDLLTLDGNTYMQPYAGVSAIALMSAGDIAGARLKLEDVLDRIRADTRRQPDAAPSWISLGLAEMILGHREAALDATGRALKVSAANDGLGRPRYLWEFNAAIVDAWIGDKNRAFDTLARLLQCPINNIFTQGVPTVHGLRTSPLFKPLKDDPRWEALLNDPKNNAPLF